MLSKVTWMPSVTKSSIIPRSQKSTSPPPIPSTAGQVSLNYLPNHCINRDSSNWKAGTEEPYRHHLTFVQKCKGKFASDFANQNPSPNNWFSFLRVKVEIETQIELEMKIALRKNWNDILFRKITLVCTFLNEKRRWRQVMVLLCMEEFLCKNQELIKFVSLSTSHSQLECLMLQKIWWGRPIPTY